MQNAEDESNNSDKVLVLPLNEDSKKVTQALSNEKALKMLEILADKPMSATTLSEKMGLPLTTIKYNLDSLIEADLIKVKETKWSQKGREIKIYEPVQKLIVVVPGTKNVDRSSIMGMLKKYLGLFISAVFAATGIEYLTRRMGVYSSANYYPSVLEEAAMKSSEYGGSINESLGYGSTVYDRATAANEASPMLATMVSNDTTDTVIMGSNQIVNATSAIPAKGLSTPYVATAGLNATDMNATIAPLQSPSSEDVTVLTGTTPGLIPPDLLAHISVWFFFGCMFVIIFMLIREIYYRKKAL
ncbi:helix-turn-helix domain-containing protein [uncultured Methanomethylovorans sp.]|uniref:helix-turn-helix domain-containing protein n=1 Tax=uncultured Methanomethylovorans sp. TaxID=183759 RepID=UPI002AA860DB|nr:helix-turn-helix domain-containing protein [uncultured Methanomethylovorans sp.]